MAGIQQIRQFQQVKKTVLTCCALMIAVGFAMTTGGCSNSDDHSDATKVSSEEAEKKSAKAAAEAEEAEEAVAKAKAAAAVATKTKATSAVKRSVASVKTSKKKKASADSIFLVQVGTFKIEDNAKKIEAKLKSAGLPAFHRKIERENGTVLYAVRIEPTPNRSEAEKFVSGVKAATGESSLILSVER